MYKRIEIHESIHASQGARMASKAGVVPFPCQALQSVLGAVSNQIRPSRFIKATDASYLVGFAFPNWSAVVEKLLGR